MDIDMQPSNMCTMDIDMQPSNISTMDIDMQPPNISTKDIDMQPTNISTMNFKKLQTKIFEYFPKIPLEMNSTHPFYPNLTQHLICKNFHFDCRGVPEL